MSTKEDILVLRTFTALLRADAILFEASKQVAALGFGDIQTTLHRERSRIAGRLGKMQSQAYTQYNQASAAQTLQNP